MGDPFVIKIKDLAKHSKAKIQYKCDTCGVIISTLYATYAKMKTGLCNTCSSSEAGGKNKLSFSTVIDMFNTKGYKLISTSEDYKHFFSKLKYICPKHQNVIQKISYGSLFQGCGCRLCANELIRNNSLGSKSHTWRGGITELSDYLRSQLSFWIREQLKRTNYTCEITGKHGTLNVHHMYSFSNILQDTMEELQLDIRPKIGDYSEDELQLITVNFLKNNDLLADPIVMLETIHKEFHKFCGGFSKETSYEKLFEFIEEQRR
jgi:hypothetical protein